MTSPVPIAVLISGSGTNLQALIDAESAGTLDCTIAVVISDRPNVKGLDRAESAGIPTVVTDWAGFDSRHEFSVAVCDAADRFAVGGMILAGFMRILTPVAIHRFPNAIINVHPALLPAFPGANAVQNAIDYGVTMTGVTVHFVDEQVDHGPIIAQVPVRVEPGDDESSLHARLQAVEHDVLPRIVAAFGRGELRVEGRRVLSASGMRGLE